MNLRNIWILIRKEFRQGAGNYMFVVAFVVPIVLTLLIALVFGDLFADKPRLGIYDASGESSLAAELAQHDGIDVRHYDSDAALQAAVERGTVEIGLALSADFGGDLPTGSDSGFVGYRWGEASFDHLLQLETVIGKAFLDSAEIQLPATINAQQLGDGEAASWSERLLPLLIIMSVMFGGLLVPASSLIEEKIRHTLVALTTTPTTLLDVYLAKMIVGFLISLVMGVVIMVLNNAFGTQPLLLLLIIALGALFAAVCGIILGSFSKDMDTFLGIVKAIGLVLYAPGILELFPQIPAWIGRIFPTYYIMNPLLAVSQDGARLGDVADELAILCAFVGLLLFAFTRVLERQQQQLALAA